MLALSPVLAAFMTADEIGCAIHPANSLGKRLSVTLTEYKAMESFQVYGSTTEFVQITRKGAIYDALQNVDLQILNVGYFFVVRNKFALKV